ncbi:MAG: class 3 adenylate cyclase [Gammaproteobacteria bacterium]|jgi:class 3 adenylate cyclase
MSSNEPKPSNPDRERGFLMIADMESSTLSKFVLSERDAFDALREHNRIVMTHCRSASPVQGLVLNSLGDAVVAKFPMLAAHPGEALTSCMSAALAIVNAFECLSSIATITGGEFRLRTKLLLQSYDAFSYGRRSADTELAEELVGEDIDLAFRLAPVSWRLQVLVTDAFMKALLENSTSASSVGHDTQALLDEAHHSRHSNAHTVEPLQGIAHAFQIAALEYWITDAREIARLKGIKGAGRVFALAFESPTSLISRGERQRLTIKVRQNRHAVILASISLAQNLNENYIGHVVEKLRDVTNGNRLDSELTLLAAAKIYGEYDYFFRVSCIDDESLTRFFDAIHADSIGVSHVEVRSIVSNRLVVTRQYERIFARFHGRPHVIILTWFERARDRDLFAELESLLESNDKAPRTVELLEVGEVIHHTPVYAVFLCESLADYAAFFSEHGFSPTACRSHLGHVERPSDAQLRYSLMDGIYMPRTMSGAE